MDKQKEYRKLRNEVLDTKGNHCVYCGRLLNTDNFCVDHAIPKARGGTDDIENLLPSCYECNGKKLNKTISEFREYIKDDVLGRLTRAQSRTAFLYGVTEDRRALQAMRSVQLALDTIGDIKIEFFYERSYYQKWQEALTVIKRLRTKVREQEEASG